MKTLIALAVLAAAIATPALAQQAQRGGPNAVYSGDQYLGADPDPNIRLRSAAPAELAERRLLSSLRSSVKAPGIMRPGLLRSDGDLPHAEWYDSFEMAWDGGRTMRSE